MKYRYFLIFLIALMGCDLQNSSKLEIPFDTNQNISADYKTSMQFYKNLAEAYPKHVALQAAGESDQGTPIHTVVIGERHKETAHKTRRKGKVTLLINNAIHPGEPCGVDATMLFVRELLEKRENRKALQDLTIVIIPLYNIGGTLRRNSTTRANQNGPEEYGFRGNAQNLDLNRDFIKCDSKNARTFAKIFHEWKPELFLDTHTSNGADYQYTITLLGPQHNLLPKPLSDLLKQKALPQLYEIMESKSWEMTPYVYAFSTPDKGIYGFYDSPRYSMGYAALFNCLSFTTETHMLKPFKDRVLSTKAFIESLAEFALTNKDEILDVKVKAQSYLVDLDEYGVDWEYDFSRFDSITFKGFEAGYKTSLVSGKERLFYNREKPYTKRIPYFNYFKPKVLVDVPNYYIVPQAAWRVVELLKLNEIKLEKLENDTVIEAEFYRIKDYETSKSPYEGHYLHSDVIVQKEVLEKQFFEGDYLIKTSQPGFRYILETLEPQAKDAFFAWNFFDSHLQRKEYFSAYVFEDEAAEMLENNVELKNKFEHKLAKDSAFAKSARDQLFFIYENSLRNEGTVNLYPIARLHSSSK